MLIPAYPRARRVYSFRPEALDTAFPDRGQVIPRNMLDEYVLLLLRAGINRFPVIFRICQDLDHEHTWWGPVGFWNYLRHSGFQLTPDLKLHTGSLS